MKVRLHFFRIFLQTEWSNVFVFFKKTEHPVINLLYHNQDSLGTKIDESDKVRKAMFLCQFSTDAMFPDNYFLA